MVAVAVAIPGAVGRRLGRDPAAVGLDVAVAIAVADMLAADPLARQARAADAGRAGPARSAADPDRVEDPDRFLTQFGVEDRVVLVGELAGGVVEFGVADFAVFRFLQLVGLGPPPRAPAAAASRP